MSRSIRHTDERTDTALTVRPSQQPQEQEGGRNRKPPSLLTIGLSVMGFLVVVGVIAALWPRGAPLPQPQPTALVAAVVSTAIPTGIATPVPTVTPVPASPTPNCPSIAPYVNIILAHEQAGRWNDAATTAEGALEVSGLCDSDRRTLTQHAITSGMKELYTHPFRPLDRTDQQQVVDRYLALKQRAHDANVAIDTPLQVASNAYAISQFHLTRVAIEEALKDGSFRPELDRDITRLYVSALYGLGKWYTTADSNNPLYQEGLRWLEASRRVSSKYQIGDGEAAMLLSQLRSPLFGEKIEPASTPLLP
jgi:hypothetical protein